MTNNRNLDADWVRHNFAQGHEFEDERLAFLAGFSDEEIMNAFWQVAPLERLDEAVSEGMRDLGYDWELNET